jgi:hypothetical protein
MNTEASRSRTVELAWFKSSYSGGEGGECVEVAMDGTVVHVRDSTDAQGPRLSFRPSEWSAFVDFAVGL